MPHLVPINPQSDLWLQEGTARAVDIETGFDDEDFISIALPDYPAASITEASSYVVFTSHPEGNFANGPTDSIPFTANQNSWSPTDMEFRFPLGLLTTVDRSAITGVRFQVEATGSTNLRVLAIRAISKDWQWATADSDTLDSSLVYPVSRTGATGGTPYAVPNLFRSDVIPGASDPTPIDTSLAVRFNTGGGIGNNRFSLYLRERTADYMTQLDLDGTLSSELDGQPQPDFGEARFLPRVQLDLDAVEDSVPGVAVDTGAVLDRGLTQADLNNTPQFDLERKPDTLKASWIEVRLSWDTDGLLEIWDAETGTPFYSLSWDTIDHKDYALFVDLKDTTFSARIYTTIGNELGDLVLDTTLVNDPEIFKRRKGRIGWSTDFDDGGASIASIEPRQLNFAEYRSHPFESITPVSGTELEVSSTPDRDLFKGIFPGPWGGQFTANPNRGPESFMIRNTAEAPLQGIQTNPVYFDDFFHTTISFDLFVTSQALEAGTMHAFLWDGILPRDLPLGPVIGDVWNSIKIDLEPYAMTTLPDNYRVVIVQTVTGIPNDWAVDKISIVRSNVEWSARAYKDDPWGEREEDWVRFYDSLNSLTSGVVFPERTTKIQYRAKALRQDAYVDHMRAKPRYAELGLPVWDRPTYTTPTISVLSYASSGLDFEFSAASVTAGGPDDWIISYYWTFGDGEEGWGRVTTHTFPATGTYPVTLIVTNNHGVQQTLQDDVVVS